MSTQTIATLNQQIIEIRAEQNKLIEADPEQVNISTRTLNQFYNGQVDGLRLAIRTLSQAPIAAETFEYRFELAGREITGTLSSDQEEGLSFLNDLILGSEDLTSVLEVRDAGKIVWSVLE